MKIAVPMFEGQVAAHFGHCGQFAFFEIDDQTRQLVEATQQTPPPHEPGVLPGWLHEQGATVVLAGGMGARAQMLLSQHGIQVVLGAANQTPEQLVSNYLQGRLACGANLCDSEGQGCNH